MSLLVLSLVLTIAQKFNLGFQLEGAFALLPLLLLFGSAIFIIVGSSVQKFPQYTYLAHVPLVLWFGVAVLTFV